MTRNDVITVRSMEPADQITVKVTYTTRRDATFATYA